MVPKFGQVCLVGAGPGDLGLLTLRAKACLEQAEVVLYDGLANIDILDFAPSAEHICVGKHGKLPFWPQTAINAKLVELAQTGQQVVRLKGGDPAVFARTAEELSVLSDASIPFEVVPGITAAMAAASYVGIPLTHRDHASAVALVTGRQQSDGQPQGLDFDALSRFPGTLVFYMGVTTAAQWTGSLIAAGKPPETPTAIVRRCTWSDQQVIRCRLDEVTEKLTPATKMRPPAVVIVGEVAKLGETWGWFEAKPLHGCGVLVTRSAGQQDRLAQLLREQGAEVIHHSAQKILPAEDTDALDAMIQAVRQGEFEGITFSSTNGVNGWFSRLEALKLDSRAMNATRIGVVGPSTAQALLAHGIRADVVPQQDYSAAGLVEALAGKIVGGRWLVTRTEASRGTLRTGLESHGAEVSEVVTYSTSPAEALSPQCVAAIQAGRIHFATATSSEIARASFQILGEHTSSIQPISLSPNISSTLRELKWPAAATATQNTLESLSESVLAAWDAQTND